MLQKRLSESRVKHIKTLQKKHGITMEKDLEEKSGQIMEISKNHSLKMKYQLVGKKAE